ncbi:hypothetical protein [Sphingobium sp. Sx8-8]|uniref:hypothetical protein n=1 Tax=Sphingobium sp. Sx8-8 TaxID=2933617 RepID=UPI001F584ADB|nr:hypothetical protein [Sphingobium sp. Sx8-8]
MARATRELDFGLSESAPTILEAAGRFACEQILSLAAEIDAQDRRERSELMGAVGLSFGAHSNLRVNRVRRMSIGRQLIGEAG